LGKISRIKGLQEGEKGSRYRIKLFNLPANI